MLQDTQRPNSLLSEISSIADRRRSIATQPLATRSERLIAKQAIPWNRGLKEYRQSKSRGSSTLPFLPRSSGPFDLEQADNRCAARRQNCIDQNSPANKYSPRWITAGQKSDSDDPTRLQSIATYPDNFVPRSNMWQRLQLSAERSDGSNRNVMRAIINIANTTPLEQVTDEGLVTANDPGKPAEDVRN